MPGGGAEGGTWCRSWWRGRRTAAGCRRGTRRCCHRRWRMRRRPPRRSTPTPCPAVTACPATPQRRRLLPLTSAPAARRQRKKECVRVWLTRRGSPPHALYRRRSGGQSGGEHARRGFGGPRCRWAKRGLCGGLGHVDSVTDGGGIWRRYVYTTAAGCPRDY